MEPRIKIWVGMGAWLLASASPVAIATVSAALTDDARAATLGTSAHPGMMAQHAPEHSQGGEGGEGGSAAVFADATPEEALMARLLLIKGHLRVGRELYDQGRADDALQHFQHPTVEVYDEIESDLAARKGRQFKPALEKLADLVEKKADKATIAAEHKKVLQAVDTAARALPAGRRNSPLFVAKVVMLVLNQAREDYEGALDGDRITNPVEYQDSRGFVLTAREYFINARTALRAKDAEAYDIMRANLDRLRGAWPSVVPPDKARMPFGDVQALISQIELRASRFH
jgi:hypothetical protein